MEHFQLTRERIRQIEARAMSKLRHPSKQKISLAVASTQLSQGASRFESDHITQLSLFRR